MYYDKGVFCMKIESVNNTIKITNLTQDILLETNEGVKVLVNMCEGAIEIGVVSREVDSIPEVSTWYTITQGGLSEVKQTDDPHCSIERLNKGEICQYCGKETQLINSDDIYGKGKNHGMILICKSCDAYVKVDKNNVGVGRVGDKQLREIRKALHPTLEKMYMGPDSLLSKKEAYNYILNKLGVHEERASTMTLTNQQAVKALKICNDYLTEQNKKSSLFKDEEKQSW